MNTQKYSNADYIDFYLWDGDDAQLSCQKVTLPKAQKDHPCFFGLGENGDKHTIKKGERYRLETALVDGDFWGKWRCCVPCMDKYLDEFTGDGDDD